MTTVEAKRCSCCRSRYMQRVLIEDPDPDAGIGVMIEYWLCTWCDRAP